MGLFAEDILWVSFLESILHSADLEREKHLTCYKTWLHLEQSDIKSQVYTKRVAYIYTWYMKKNWEVMSVLLVRYDEWRAALSPDVQIC
jgi:hypothetical protein